MLKRLTIDNFALINHIDVAFDDGLSIITGETGAGKSIIIGALSLLLGSRADSKSVKDRNEKMVVEAVFDIGDYDLRALFESYGLDYFPEETIVRRELLPSGRSRAFINDMPVQLATLSELTLRLVDIHSQHSNALLLKPAYQLAMLDDLSGNGELLKNYREAFQVFQNGKKAFEVAKSRIEKNKSDEEYFRFQLNQLETANLKSDEQEALEKEQNVLENQTQIKESLSFVSYSLSGNENSAVDAIKGAIRSMSQISHVYDGASEMVERLESAKIDLQDIAETVERDCQNIGGDESDLERVESRLSLIYGLQQKFHAETVDGLLEIQASLKKSLDEIDNSEEELQSLREQMDRAGRKVSELALSVTQSRKDAAALFLSQLERKTSFLGLNNFRGEIGFEQTQPCATGQDKVQFRVAFNKNQQPMPIETTASGGEISRLMLCVKTILAEKMKLPTIVFDEVDTGVSGEVANRIGEMMCSIADKIQVLTITHLPQVAALGTHHYKVYKQDVAEETVTAIKSLDHKEKVLEIAGMLSGAAIDAAAIANAESLIRK